MMINGMDTSIYKEKDVLFLIRIKGKKHFFEKIYSPHTIENLFGHISNHHTISEYRNGNHYIDINRYDLSDFTSEDYDVYYACIHKNLESIIWRCRALRALPFHEAKTLVLKTCKFFYDFFKEHPYQLLVFHIIDNYVIDIMIRIAEYRKIKTLCLSEWFMKGYYRHTLYGELHSLREPTEIEVQEVYDHCSSKKKAFWLDGVTNRKLIFNASRLYIRHWILYVARYLFQHKLFKSMAYEHRFANVFNRIKINHFFIKKYFDTITEEYVLENKDRLIVLPLHTFPEANVDYWINDCRHADYYTTLFETVSFFRDKDKIILIKEHPGFMYQRDPDFYKQLRKFENVKLIHPFSDSSALLDLISTVLVWHGTSGIEALIQDKKVIAFDYNYYSDKYIPAYRDFETAKPIDKQQQMELIHKLLSGVQRYA